MLNIKTFLDTTKLNLDPAIVYQSNEIRRFEVDLNYNHYSHQSLLARINQNIQNYYNFIKSASNELNLYWKDEDGDLVAILNDDDLSYACKLNSLYNSPKSKLNIYLFPKIRS